MEMFEEQSAEWSSEERPIIFLEDKQISSLPAPLIRVHCCGLLSLEVLTEVVSTDPPRGRYRVIPTHTLRGRGAVPAMMLLKLLVSQPHRFANKDWLATQMQDEMETGALVRLDTMASQLRSLLCMLEREEETSALRLRLVEYLRNGRGSGPGYRLAPYPLIWLDSDALTWNVEQGARMERFGHPDSALPFWQRAYALASRGTYLPDDLYSEWAADKQAQVEGALRQSVHALARFYLAQQAGAGTQETMRLLLSYWLSHKTDEDALRPLMELLGKQERYQEAEQYYQQLCETLDATESGKQPDERTRDIREFLRTRQIYREQETSYRADVIKAEKTPTSFSLNPQQDETFSSFSHAVTQGIIEAVRELEENFQLDTSTSVTRRTVVASLLGIPPALFTLDWRSTGHLVGAMQLLEEGSFALYEDILILGRGCLNNGGSVIAQRIDGRLNTLITLTQEAPGRDRSHWQSLLCHFYQLSSSFAHRDTKKAQALNMATNAVTVALERDDVELIACSFFRRGRIYLDYSIAAANATHKQRYLALAKADIDAALDEAGRLRAPLQGNIYLIAAEVYAPYAQHDASLRKQCEQWQDQVGTLVSRGNIEDDGTFLHLDATALHHEKAKTLLHFGHLQEARSELTSAWKTLQPSPLTWHINLHLTEANLYRAEGDLEGSAKSGIAAYTIAKAMPSRKGEAGAKRLFEDLQQRDAAHPSIRDLGMMLGMV